MKLHISFALCLLLTASAAIAADSDDPLLDAKLAVVELSSRYADKHPKLIEARALVDAFSKTLPVVPPDTYAVHLQEHLRDAQVQEAEFNLRYGKEHPGRDAISEKIKFLREELHRTEH